MEKLQFEEIKDNLKYNLYELFDDFINDIRITLINEEDIIITINVFGDSNYNDDYDRYNYMRMPKSDFKDLEYNTFKKILNELNYYAQ